MALAIFDLDDTLINGDSDFWWIQFLCRKCIVDANEYTRAYEAFDEQYRNGTMNIFEYLEFGLNILTQRPLSESLALREEFIDKFASKMILPKGQALINEHKAKGDHILIISATNDFVIEPLAKILGVDDFIGAKPEMVDGEYTGRVSGTPSFGVGKITRLNEWLETNPHSMEGSYFYSDSRNDIPLLEKVSHPIATNPDEVLLAHAKTKGWKVLNLKS